MVASNLHSPATRASQYGSNIAKYLVDLHDSKATFDFCGGMLFQLVLSDVLRQKLASVSATSEAGGEQPAVYDAKTFRMQHMPGYNKSAEADNVKCFHGREVRQVVNAAGGMNFVLQLVLAGGDDVEGWTKQEFVGYDGWGHDRGRVWRKGAMLEQEGYKGFRSKFGEAAFTLHHRFYLHLGGDNNLWLSAEDGCEGQVARAPLPRKKMAPWMPF